MAIEIRNKKGQIADLGDDTVLNIDRFCSLFSDEDKLFQDITYPMTLPRTPTNITFFGGGHLVDASNDLYQIEVQVSLNGTSFFAGSLEYSIEDGDFSVLLLVNFGDIRNRVKETLISELYVPENFPAFSTALMYDTCLHPERYDFAYFPVYNEAYAGDGWQYPFTNFWNHTTQQFIYDNLDEGGTGSSEKRRTRQSNFFKLKYLVKKICSCLGFEAVGSFMDDSENDSIYLYTDVVNDFERVTFSHLVLPREMTIETFFKILRARFRITFVFNLLTGRVVVNSAKDLLRSTDFVELENFVTNVKKFNPPDKQGYSVVLKADSTDQLFRDPLNAENAIPTNKMIIGDGEKAIEIEASTLKKGTGDGYIYPKAKHQVYASKRDESSTMLRFLRFKGFKQVGAGKIFPEALPMELDMEDANWYRLLNDSKVVELQAEVPVNVLLELDLSKKISFTSEDGAFIKCLGEYCKYSITNANDELIGIDLKGWSINFQPSTPVMFTEFIEENNTTLERSFKIKALFPSAISPLKVELFYPAGTQYYKPPDGTLYTLPSDYIQEGFLLRSSDKYRGGGTRLYLERLMTYGPFVDAPRIRVYVQPKHLITGGNIVNFTYNATGKFWECQFGLQSDVENTVWIIF